MLIEGGLEHVAGAVLLPRAAPGAVSAQYRVPSHDRLAALAVECHGRQRAWVRSRFMPIRPSKPARRLAIGRTPNSAKSLRSVPGPTTFGSNSHTDYSLVAVRDATILNILYPASEPRWHRLKVSFEGRVVGWAVVLCVPMEDHNYFGNMRVGSLIDCMALPGSESKVTTVAMQFLQATRGRHRRDQPVAPGLAAGPGSRRILSRPVELHLCRVEKSDCPARTVRPAQRDRPHDARRRRRPAKPDCRPQVTT